VPLDFSEVYHFDLNQRVHNAHGENFADVGDVDSQLADHLQEARDAVGEALLADDLCLGHLTDEDGQVLGQLFFGVFVEDLVKEAVENIFELRLLVVAHVLRGSMKSRHKLEVPLIFCLVLLNLILGRNSNKHAEILDHLLANVVLTDLFKLGLRRGAV